MARVVVVVLAPTTTLWRLLHDAVVAVMQLAATNDGVFWKVCLYARTHARTLAIGRLAGNRQRNAKTDNSRL
jgi:hypothetical protein